MPPVSSDCSAYLLHKLTEKSESRGKLEIFVVYIFVRPKFLVAVVRKTVCVCVELRKSAFTPVWTWANWVTLSKASAILISNAAPFCLHKTNSLQEYIHLRIYTISYCFCLFNVDVLIIRKCFIEKHSIKWT